MDNHLHIVMSVLPDYARQWSKEEVAERWLKLFPSSKKEQREQRLAKLLGDDARIGVLRGHLSSLSWFMRCANEYLAKRFNAEDECTGRFWQGRYKSQALLSEKALLAAMVYVDLNPIRAGIAENLPMSHHTGVLRRLSLMETKQRLPSQKLAPLAGYPTTFFSISEADYIELTDWSGRQCHPGKVGKIAESEPRALARLNLKATHWTHKVKGVGSAYWRVIGSVEEMIEKAKQMKQSWLRGIGFARLLEGMASNKTR
jgi:hypothetical protein